MLNTNGYLELVLYSSPISIFTLILMPFLFNKGKFLKVSQWLSIFMYWFDNFFFLTFAIMHLILLIPYNYVTKALSVIRVTFTMGASTQGPVRPFTLSLWLLIPYMGTLAYILPLWLIMGPPFLIMAFFKDIYYIIKAMKT